MKLTKKQLNEIYKRFLHSDKNDSKKLKAVKFVKTLVETNTIPIECITLDVESNTPTVEINKNYPKVHCRTKVYKTFTDVQLKYAKHYYEK